MFERQRGPDGLLWLYFEEVRPCLAVLCALRSAAASPLRSALTPPSPRHPLNTLTLNTLTLASAAAAARATAVRPSRAAALLRRALCRRYRGRGGRSVVALRPLGGGRQQEPLAQGQGGSGGGRGLGGDEDASAGPRTAPPEDAQLAVGGERLNAAAARALGGRRVRRLAHRGRRGRRNSIESRVRRAGASKRERERARKRERER